MLRLDHDQFMADVLVKHGWTPPSGAELVAGKPGWQVSGTAPRLPLNWPLHLPLNLSVVTALPLQLLQLSRTVLPRPSVTVAMWRTSTRSPKPQPELPRLSGAPHSADHHCSSRESGHELHLTPGLQPGSPRRLRRRMIAMSMTATAASANSTATKPIGALIEYAQIAKAVQVTKPNAASHSRNVRALRAGAAPPIPAVGSW